MQNFKLKTSLFYFIFLFGILINTTNSFAQKRKPDVIFKTDNSKIECTVMEVEDNRITYKKPNDPKILSIVRSMVAKVVYSDGTVENFTKVKAKEVDNTPETNPSTDLPFQKGNILLSGGVAFYGGKSIVNGSVPLTADIEYAISDNLSGGISIEYGSFDYLGTKGYTIFTTLRGLYHISNIMTTLFNGSKDNLDLYVGIKGGLGISSTTGALQINGSLPIYGFLVGGRYYFTSRLAGNLEFSSLGIIYQGGISDNFYYPKLGITFKF